MRTFPMALKDVIVKLVLMPVIGLATLSSASEKTAIMKRVIPCIGLLLAALSPAQVAASTDSARCESKATLMLRVTWEKGQGKSRKQTLAGKRPAELSEDEYSTLVRRYRRYPILPSAKKDLMNLLALAEKRHDDVLQKCLANATG